MHILVRLQYQSTCKSINKANYVFAFYDYD